MSETASTASGIAGRYALAVFDLAQESKEIAALENDIASLGSALSDSADLRALIASPVYSRQAQGAAIAAIADRMGVSAIMRQTLGLLASNRRLFVLPQLLDTLTAKIAADKGEVSADVVSATPLNASQSKKIAASLKKVFGKDVKLNVAVDASLIGGLIVKVGSKMIDTSIRAKLAALQNAMKEVG